MITFKPFFGTDSINLTELLMCNGFISENDNLGTLT